MDLYGKKTISMIKSLFLKGKRMQNIHEISQEQLQAFCVEKGHKPFSAKQIMSWVYQKKARFFEGMTNLSSALRKELAQAFFVESCFLSSLQESEDGQTTKFLWKLCDGSYVESVLIRAPERKTVCVSSQVGCPARCAFCASGKEGLIRNLSVGEIVEQVFAMERFLEEKKEEGGGVSHIVYMGMGEPLENYTTVVQSLRILTDPERGGFSERKITVSTVGVVEGILALAKEGLRVNLVLSLHAPNQHIRKKIIPYARKYELEDVLQAIRTYAFVTKRDITYEYTLLAGINDSIQHAQELAALVRDDACTVNLIPYNPISGVHLKRPSGEEIEKFRSVLESRGVVTTWRYTKGKDIAAACGQLALKKECVSAEEKSDHNLLVSAR